MIPSVPFVAYVKGKLANGQAFERSHDGVTQPQYVAISAPMQQAVHPGSQVEYVFQLQNRGAADRFAVRVSDPGGFVVSAREQMLPLAAGESSRIVVTAKAVPMARIGARSTIHVDVASVTQPSLSTYGSVDLEVTEILDLDDDSIPNAQDNCPSTANEAQLDYDRDGAGNECDTTPGEPPPETGCRTSSGRDSSPPPLPGTFLLAALVVLSKMLRRKHGRTR
jgi:hypothetical protein